jgi:hypothetical protein
MATSPIYSWPEPDNTDLVKNGALAIRTLGNAIDTTMGTMVAKTIIDAKGDLIAGTAADTAARLAVGNNGETLVADSSTSTGLRYQATKSTQNAIINGGMDIWQRGTSFTTTNVYSADRWYTFNASTTGSTFSRQTGTGDFQYLMRVARDSGNTSTGQRALWYSSAIEEATQFAGKTVTLSFYARKGANYSSASDLLNLNLYSGTGTSDVNRVNAGYTGDTLLLNNVNATLTTTLTRFSFTFTFGASITQFGFGFNYTPVGTAGAADYFEITGVQLEVGSVATTFRRSGGTLQGELAACQRYYIRMGGTAAFEYLGAIGNAGSTTAADIMYQNIVTMRTTPSAIEYSLLSLYDGVAIPDCTAISALYSSPKTQFLRATSSSLTQYRNYQLIARNSTSAYLAFSAEL